MYDKASIALIPSGYKAGSTDNLYSVLPANGNGDFNATRGSTATRVNKDGLIETVATNVPRLDYPLTNGVVGDCPHLLLEPSRTNNIPYSQFFDSGSGWSLLNNVTIGSQVSSPDGSLNATELVYDGTLNGRIERTISGLTAGVDYSVSLYARVASGTQEVFFGSYEESSFILTTEWQRLIKSQPENDTNAFPRIKCNDAATIEIWGFQHEAGSYATSYIPTLQNQAETRSADICNDSGTSAEFNDSEGVLFAEIAALANDGTYRRIAIPNTGLTALHRLEYFSTDNAINAVTYVSPSNQVVLSHTLPDSTKFVKIAYKYKTGDFALWVNGVEVGTSVSGNLPTGLTKLNFDNGSGSNDFYGKCKQLIYFNEALSDSELQTLTS